MKTRNKWFTAAGVGLGSIALIAASAGVANAVNSADRPEGHRGGSQSSLVADGTLTKAQAQAIHDAMHAAVDADREAEVKTTLAALVTKGTITQSQADAISASMAAEAEAEAGSHRGGRGGHLRELVDAGTITKAQADAVHEAMHASRPTEAERAATLNTVLADLVTKGTITQAQADAVKANKADRGMSGDRPGRGHGKGGHGKGGHSQTTSPTNSPA